MYERNSKKVQTYLSARGAPASLSKPAETSKQQLLKLWDEFTTGGYGLVVEWDYNYNKKTMYDRPVILNIGNPFNVGGTHWVSVYRDKYFDSFGLPPPSILYANGWTGAWNDKQIQAVNRGNCGQFALLFLLYATKARGFEGGLEKFYKLFY